MVRYVARVRVRRGFFFLLFFLWTDCVKTRMPVEFSAFSVFHTLTRACTVNFFLAPGQSMSLMSGWWLSFRCVVCAGI